MQAGAGAGRQGQGHAGAGACRQGQEQGEPYPMTKEGQGTAEEGREGRAASGWVAIVSAQVEKPRHMGT